MRFDAKQTNRLDVKGAKRVASAGVRCALTKGNNAAHRDRPFRS